MEIGDGIVDDLLVKLKIRTLLKFVSKIVDGMCNRRKFVSKIVNEIVRVHILNEG